MKVVNINDIEDLILAKHEIDLIRIDHNEISERSILNEFIYEYVTPKYTYILNDKNISFNYVKIYDNDYLFVTENNEDINKILINRIQRLKYNMDNLVELSKTDLTKLMDANNVIIYNGKYYN